jgi:hypothetical protein
MRQYLFIALAAAGCATAVGTPYRAADRQGFGFAETRIESDRYRVVFAGDGATSAGEVEDFALLRAAEIGLANGYEWFRVVSKDISAEKRGGVGLGAGVGGGGSNVGVGVGGNFGSIGARTFYTARMEVLYGKGERPAADASGGVYDAQSVADSIRARINPDKAQ